MLKINDKRGECPIIHANVGQIRANDYGRVVLVIVVRHKDYAKQLKTVILKEGRNGTGEAFYTVPKEWNSLAEITEKYPIILNGELTVHD